MEITRSFDLLNQYKTKFANKPDALASKVDKNGLNIPGRNTLIIQTMLVMAC